MPTPPPRCCAECGAPHAHDQHYCLECGARNGPRSPALERILAELPVGAAAGVQVPVASETARRARGGLPGPRVAAVLVLAMLGFGTVAGAAASNPSGALNAVRRGPLTLLVPPPPVTHALAAAPPPVVEAPTPEPSSSSSGSSEEPSSEESNSSTGESRKQGGKGGSKKSGSGASEEAAKLPPVKHVFLIVLANQAYAQTFGPESPAPYIAHTLEHKGELMVRFYGVAHDELADEVAMISGLGPTPQTAADCPEFTDIIPGQANSKGQYTGSGCIYPTEAQTIGEQLASKGLAWKVYAEGLSSPCAHPEFGVADPTAQAPEGDTYATFRNPFTYFDGVLHSPDCAKNDVPIGGLAHDLKSAKRTPAFSYIVPDLCHDGRATPCAPGAPSGLAGAEAFLRRVVPEILASPAYKKNGLLILTTDQAPTTGEYADSSSCCVQPRFPAPALPIGVAGSSGAGSGATGTTGASTGSTTATALSTAPGATATATATTSSSSSSTTTSAPTTTTPSTTTPSTTTPSTTTPSTTTPAATTPTSAPDANLPPRGGGQVGALLISRYVKPATFNQEPFNDFSLLRTLENLFALPPLGYAATHGNSSFEASVFSAWSGAEANSS
jgi:phosphatidylinositol-3-phosphatase